MLRDAKGLDARLRKLEAASGGGFAPVDGREIVDGTAAEIAAQLAEIGRRPGRWIARVIVPPLDALEGP